jgi:hypothetical protein
MEIRVENVFAFSTLRVSLSPPLLVLCGLPELGEGR